MHSATRLSFDVAVVGGGPAGIAAAAVAAESGASVVLVDDNPGLGGQIWRGESKASHYPKAANWFERLQKSPATVIGSAQVFHAERGILGVECGDATYGIAHRKLILATGARERFLPFPGWTLPNVFGAGGLQALVKQGLPVVGKSVVIAGTGPLLLAVAFYLKERGAKVVCICEQTTRRKFNRFGLNMLLVRGKMREALHLGWGIRNIPHYTDCWPVAAMGTDRLERVRLSHQGKIREIDCDYLACGFHLIPNLELDKLIGCRLLDGFVEVDEYQQTSAPGVFCAGEPTGIGGLELALIEGQIAGYAASNQKNHARELFGERAAFQKVVRLLIDAFSLRSELKALAQPDTLVCRCEDLSLRHLQQYGSWRDAKLQARCGMGPCQGRVCGAAAEFLFGWDVSSIRPPLFPVRCSSLAAIMPGAKTERINGGIQ